MGSVYRLPRHIEGTGMNDWDNTFPPLHLRARSARFGRALHYEAVRGHGEVVGLVSLYRDRERANTVEVAFWVDPVHRGRGMGTELCRLGAERARRLPGIGRVVMACAEENAAAQRIAEKVGAVLLQVLPDGCLYRGGLCAVHLYLL